MKTLTLGTILTSMWSSPVIALLILIALVFIADLLNRYLESCSTNRLVSSKKITCVATDWNAYSYRDIQAYAKLHGIKANKKRTTLTNQLQGV